MKKLIAITVAIFFVLSASICFAKGASSSGHSSSAGRSTSISTSKSTSGISSKSYSNSSPSSNGTVYKSGGGVTSSKTQQKEQMARDNHSNLQTTARNSYYNPSYGGYNSWGTGFWTGMMAGSLFHPWSMVTPVGYGGGYGGYAQAPMSMMILYFVIDIIMLCLFIWVIYWIYKKASR